MWLKTPFSFLYLLVLLLREWLMPQQCNSHPFLPSHCPPRNRYIHVPWKTLVALQLPSVFVSWASGVPKFVCCLFKKIQQAKEKKISYAELEFQPVVSCVLAVFCLKPFCKKHYATAMLITLTSKRHQRHHNQQVKEHFCNSAVLLNLLVIFKSISLYLSFPPVYQTLFDP